MILETILAEQLRRHEAERLRMYKCSAGKWSIGVGRNLEDRGIRRDEMDLMLKNDIAEAIADARKAVKNFDSLTPNRQAVVANMVFNLGLARFQLFVNTIQAIESRDWAGAKLHMLDSDWAEQVGSRAQELAKLMEDG